MRHGMRRGGLGPLQLGLFPCLLVALGAGACRRLPLYQSEREGEVALRSATADFQDGSSGIVTLVLEVQNPDAQAVLLEEAQLELWLDRRWFAASLMAVEVSLPPGKRTPVALQVPLAFQRRPTRPGEAGFDLAVRGRLTLESGPARRQLVFEAAQRVRAHGVPILAEPDEE